MSIKTSSRVACLLPNRIGDCLMALPAVATLAETFPHRIEVLADPFLLPLLDTFSFPWQIRPMHWQTKARSWVHPYAYALHLLTSHTTWGLRSTLHAGKKVPQKSWIHFDEPLPFLDVHGCKTLLSTSLQRVIIQDLGLSYSILQNMGIGPACFEQPESTWLNTFQSKVYPHLWIKPPALDSNSMPAHWPPCLLGDKPYITICMEAAYGSKRNENRRWASRHWVTLLDALLAQFPDLDILVLGSEKTPLPLTHPRLWDLRRQLSLLQVASVLTGASLYIGNDSGLLHLASYTQTPKIGLYHVTDALHYGPVHPQTLIAFEGDIAYEQVLQSAIKTISQAVSVSLSV